MLDHRTAFIRAACVPLDASHASGTIAQAQAILAAHPDVASSDIYTAAILGDEPAVRRFLALDPASATAPGGPHGWDALTHLCFSNYLKLDRARTEGFVRAATALLDAGADPNTGWFETHHQPKPEWECALNGAAGVARHPELTRLLLERGADPNDDEVVYHTPETGDNAALKVLVGTGRVTADNLGLMLGRKADWHDAEGIAYLLGRGADPNRPMRWGQTPLQHAIRRDNDRRHIEAMLDHGGDPTSVADGRSAVQWAARRGRGDLLALFERRGFTVALRGVEHLIAACARNDAAAVGAIAQREPGTVGAIVAEGGRLLAEFAGTWNTDGVRHLLDLGVPVSASYAGDGYFDIAEASTALHVAAWKGVPSTVKLLVARGAPVDAKDGKGRTPLALAVKACVDSYWTERRTPETVAALLQAGASAADVAWPSGYDEVDQLLARHR